MLIFLRDFLSKILNQILSTLHLRVLLLVKMYIDLCRCGIYTYYCKIFEYLGWQYYFCQRY